ncbi:TPA_asm: phage head morphogenesis protein [Listeria monocytogenes]|nr:phage head morphogenesis protein [Listeria monocytogenes]
MTQKQNREYWEKRTAEIFSELDKRDLNYFYELQALYSRYNKQIQKELFAFYDLYAREGSITLQEARKKALAEDLSDYVQNAEQYRKQAKKDPELLKRLDEQLKTAKLTRLELLLADLNLQLLRMGVETERSFFGYLKNVVKYVYRNATKGLASSTLDEKAIENILALKWEGGNYSSRIWKGIDRLALKLKESLVRGFVGGLSASEMARYLRKDFNVSRSQSETLLRTESGHVANLTTLQGYKEMGLTEYQFSAHLDNRTSKVCKSLNNQIFLIKDYQPGLNAPPMHPNCRSTIVPTDKEINSL